MLKPTAKAAINLLKAAGCTPKGSNLVYYSGLEETRDVYETAQRFARERDMMTINMFLKKHGIGTGDWTPGDWSATCRTAGEEALGKVPVILGKALGEKNVWENDELPALKANTKVTDIVQYTVNTKGRFEVRKYLKGGPRRPDSSGLIVMKDRKGRKEGSKVQGSSRAKKK